MQILLTVSLPAAFWRAMLNAATLGFDLFRLHLQPCRIAASAAAAAFAAAASSNESTAPSWLLSLRDCYPLHFCCLAATAAHVADKASSSWRRRKSVWYFQAKHNFFTLKARTTAWRSLKAAKTKWSIEAKTGANTRTKTRARKWARTGGRTWSISMHRCIKCTKNVSHSPRPVFHSVHWLDSKLKLVTWAVAASDMDLAYD